MSMSVLNRFIGAMPKAELHLHIEGTLEPEMMIALAYRNGIRLPYANVEAVRRAFAFGSLQDFLDVYYAGMSVLVTSRDFFDLAFAYLSRMHAQNVRHVEIFFDPQGHTARGVSFDTVLSGLVDALERAKHDFGISSKLIMCFLRHLPEEEAFSTLKDACRCRDHIFAIGLDSSEKGHPPSKFSRVYREARQQGFVAAAHAGEEGPPAYVCEALDDLEVKRIDHGNRALEDPYLVQRLVNDQVPMTVCPLSNQRLQVCPDLTQHPLRRMLKSGLLVSVNSDDPSYFGGYITENFIAIQSALDLERSEIIQLGRNAFKSSFMADAEKQSALDQFDDFVERFDWH
jgi:adenosine deaminase